MNQSLFKAYDIRGIYPSEIDEKAVYAIARAAVRFLKARSITIAMDNRESSPALKKSVLDALMDEGVYVIDAGVTTTPLFYFAVNQAHTDGGIMITASHNSPQYNGLKLTSKSARPIGENSGLLDIKQLACAGGFGATAPLVSYERSELENNKYSRGMHDGAIKNADYLDAYVDFLLKDISIPHITLAIDAACGPVGMIIDKIAARTDIKVLPLCFAPCAQLAHEGNPMKDENVKDLVAVLQHNKADLGVAFDGDADRVFFFDKTGERISTHTVACVLARHYLALHKGATIIADVRMPKIFQETVKKNGGVFLESRVGHAFIKQLMRERGAVFAAETSGHFYFKDFFNADSGMFALTRILDIITREKKSLADLVKPYLKRFQSGELNYTVKDKQMVMNALEKAFPDASISRLDGLSAHFLNWWFNVRPSNTEPYLRLNIEANTKELLKQAREKVEEVISE